MAGTMKAWVFERTGLEGLAWTDVPLPEPGPGEVRVRLRASALNHRDLYFLEGRSKAAPGAILGSDGAGVVEAIGDGVTGVRVGDEVLIVPSLGWPAKSDAPPEGFRILGVPDPGTLAEAIVVPAEGVVPKPPYLSWEEAAALPLSSLTAYRAVVTRAAVRAGETVLIPGIGGAVAQSALLIARALGARVFATSRSPEKAERARALGAERVFDTAGDFAEAARAATGGRGVDVVVETVGGVTFGTSLRALRRGGRLVTFAAGYGGTAEIDIRSFFYGQYTLLGTTMGSTEEFREMVTFFAVHGLRPVVDRVYPAEAAREAFERLLRSEQFGKIVLRWTEGL
ncbi:zinc-binding dehydrogenase [Hydrogenibacillus schlegelii]|nr:zinc-binding dehydrogenase [Hydrogenibacillus schlegelii]